MTSFFKFDNRDPFQPDYGSTSVHWIYDPDRIYIDLKSFNEVNSYFDDEADIITEPFNATATGNILHLFPSDSSTGIALPVPTKILEDSGAFAVELWVAFESFYSSNFTILGVPNQPWDQGFSIGGVMTPSSATVACILDTELVSSMDRTKCYADTKFCHTLRSTRTWYHLFCSRRDIDRVIEKKPEPPPDTPEKKDGTGDGTDTEEEPKEEPKEDVYLSNVVAIMALDNDVIKYSAESKVESEQLTLYATIGELFSEGEIVLGAKYNKDTGVRTPSFNGYVRELRIWSKDIEVEASRYIQRVKLDPMAYGALAGYWPLFGGILENFADLSGHRTEGIVEQKEATKYNGGAGEWVQVSTLASFPYCSKGYVYHQKTSSCVLTRRHTGLFINKTTSSNSKACLSQVYPSKAKLSGDGITLSVWVYLKEEIIDESILIAIDGFAGIASNNGHATPKVVTYKTDEKKVEGVPFKLEGIYKPPTGRWIYYALAVSKVLEKAYFFYDENPESFHVPLATNERLVILDGEFTNVTIGRNIVGSIREAKIWDTSLVKAYSKDNVNEGDYTAIWLEKFQ